jgi:hypothetical protein
MPQQLAERMAKACAKFGRSAASFDFKRVKSFAVRTSTTQTVWRVPVLRGGQKPSRDFSQDNGVSDVRGFHMTNNENAVKILGDLELRGSRELPNPYIRARMDVKSDEEILKLFEQIVDAGRNESGIAFEMHAFAEVVANSDPCYLEFCNRTNLCGTYWDQWVAGETDRIAHFKSARENRYCIPSHRLEMKAVWVCDWALNTWRDISF